MYTGRERYYLGRSMVNVGKLKRRDLRNYVVSTFLEMGNDRDERQKSAFERTSIVAGLR